MCWTLSSLCLGKEWSKTCDGARVTRNHGSLVTHLYVFGTRKRNFDRLTRGKCEGTERFSQEADLYHDAAVYFTKIFIKCLEFFPNLT